MAKKKRVKNSISININNNSDSGKNPQSLNRYNYPDKIIDFIIKIVGTMLIQLIS